MPKSKSHPLKLVSKFSNSSILPIWSFFLLIFNSCSGAVCVDDRRILIWKWNKNFQIWEIKIFKYEKYFKTLPLPASLNCHASMGQLRFVSSGANTLISVETYFKFCISKAWTPGLWPWEIIQDSSTYRYEYINWKNLILICAFLGRLDT